VVVHIKGFADSEGDVMESDYFARDDRQNITWSIQVQGKFLQPHSADDILFGNTFDRPLKLPWGAGAALKFMHFVDPTLEHDLTSDAKPWALSPLISTMPHFTHTPTTSLPPQFPSAQSIDDDTSHLKLPPKNGGAMCALTTANKRRAYFSQAKHRRAVTFGPDDVITTDFCYGFITFPELSLCLPGGISFDLTKYWDGQPVRFVCCERAPDGTSGLGGEYFWCVAIERVPEGEE